MPAAVTIPAAVNVTRGIGSAPPGPARGASCSMRTTPTGLTAVLLNFFLPDENGGRLPVQAARPSTGPRSSRLAGCPPLQPSPYGGGGRGFCPLTYRHHGLRADVTECPTMSVRIS